MKYSEEFIQRRWADILNNVDKYFNKPIVNNDDDMIIREFIVSQKEVWAFDMLRRLICNYDLKELMFTDCYQVFFRPCSRLTGAYKSDEGVIYSIHTKPYLNNNTRVVIKIEK